MRRPTLVCAIAVLTASACFAQVQAPQGFKLSGTVLNAATGEPVRRALVQVNASNQFLSTTSGIDGRFEFTGVPAGRASVIAGGPGFYADPTQTPVIVVSADVTGLSIKISPLSKIVGRLVDREGEPIEGVQLVCLRSMVQMGRRQDVQSGGSVTDEQGSFTIPDLQPGSYYLATQTTPLYPGASAKAEASRYVYPQTFYPGAETRDAAQAITVATGAEMRVDMSLHSVRGIRVRATLQTHYRFMILNMSRDEGALPINAQIDENHGLWTFTGVTAGTWKISAFGPFGPEQKGPNDQIYGEAEIQVTGQDIDQLTIPLNKLTDIHATASAEFKSGVQMTLRSSSGEVNSTHVDSNGVAQIPNVKPGTYNIALEAFGQCVSSVLAGSQDLLQNQLVVQPGASLPAIQINAGNDCADLSLTASQGGTLAAVILRTGDDSFAREVLIGHQATLLNGLRPGEYTVFAFNNLDGLEYRNADVMRGYRSQSVTVGPGQKAALQVEVNERRK